MITYNNNISKFDPGNWSGLIRRPGISIANVPSYTYNSLQKNHIEPNEMLVLDVI